MSDRMTTRDIYVRHTAGDGTSYVQSHTVWDSDKFIASLQQAAQALNVKEIDPDKRKAKAEQISEAQYLKERASTRSTANV